MNSDSLRRVYFEQAIQSDQKSDKQLWRSALFCSKVVGKFERGATIGLASDMGRSVDTIEDRAHAYSMFEYLCRIGEVRENGKLVTRGSHREFVFSVRRLPYIHLSHFRAMYDAKRAFDLSDGQLLGLLIDIVKEEGISSRDIEKLIRGHYGKEKTWLYHASRIGKEISGLLNHPDTPHAVRKTFMRVMKILPKKDVTIKSKGE